MRQRRDCTIVRVSTSELPRDLRFRARMSLSVDDRTLRFEAVAEMVDGELVVAAIAPYGRRLFTARQRDREISVESHSTRDLEHVGAWVMDALHRIYWVRQRQIPDEDVPRDLSGNHNDAAASRVVIDRYVTEDEGKPAVRIRNLECGYEAVVVELAAVALFRVPSMGAENPGSRSN